MSQRHIVSERDTPSALRPPVPLPLALGSMSRAELDEAIARSVESIRAGKTIPEDEVDAILAMEFGI